MSKILFLTKMNADEIVAEIETSLAESFNFQVTKNMSEIDTCDIIIAGFGDQALDDYHLLISTLADKREAGKSILFLHGNPNEFPGSNQEETYEYYNNIYKNNLSRLGIVDSVYEDFKESSGMIIEKSNHVVFSNFYDLTSLSPMIGKTHLTGVKLSSSFEIVSILGNTINVNGTNYYLALLSEENKGKVAVMNFGHNDYNIENVNSIPKYEAKLFVNVLEWLK
jgi:hypothetical protein